MNHIALLEGGADGAVQTVLEEQVSLPFHDVGEQIAEVGRILVEEMIEIKLGLCRHELIEPYLRGRNLRPGALSKSVIGVGPSGVHSFENHSFSLKGDV